MNGVALWWFDRIYKWIIVVLVSFTVKGWGLDLVNNKYFVDSLCKLSAGTDVEYTGSSHIKYI